MKIGIITNVIDEGYSSYSVYVSNVIKQINMLDKKNEFVLIHHSNTDHEIYTSNDEILIPLPHFKFLKNNFWRYHNLKKYLQSSPFDIIHDPTGPGALTFPMPFKKIITVYDLSSLLFPTYNVGGMISWRLLGKKTIKNVDKIIAISNSTKRDIIHFFGCPEEKIQTIYLGKDEIFFPIHESEKEKFKERYNLNFPYILYVGVLQPRKNIPNLIKAFNIFKKMGMPHKLVIAGGKGWQFTDIFKTVQELHLQNEVIFTGFIPYEDLPGLYNAAELFVFPSIYEGFGIPALEAMACGIPVITSNSSSLPEIVGETGVMVDPYNLEQLAHSMKEVLTDESYKKEIIKNGLQRANLFSWKRCAEETLDVYHEIGVD